MTTGMIGQKLNGQTSMSLELKRFIFCHRRGCIAAVIAAAAGLFWFVQREELNEPVVTSSALARLHATCVQKMVASNCAVMKTGASTTAAIPGDVVFVAGVGAVDAVEYQKMFAAGDAMCTVVRDACAKEWDSGQCRTARELLKSDF